MDVVTSQRWMLGSLNFICGCFYITPLKPLFLPGIPWSLLLDINGTFLHHTRGWTFLLDTMVVVTGLFEAVFTTFTNYLLRSTFFIMSLIILFKNQRLFVYHFPFEVVLVSSSILVRSVTSFPADPTRRKRCMLIRASWVRPIIAKKKTRKTSLFIFMNLARFHVLHVNGKYLFHSSLFWLIDVNWSAVIRFFSCSNLSKLRKWLRINGINIWLMSVTY